MITVLHRGGRGGVSLGTPKSDYVICARSLTNTRAPAKNQTFSEGLRNYDNLYAEKEARGEVFNTENTGCVVVLFLIRHNMDNLGIWDIDALMDQNDRGTLFLKFCCTKYLFAP